MRIFIPLRNLFRLKHKKKKKKQEKKEKRKRKKENKTYRLAVTLE